MVASITKIANGIYKNDGRVISVFIIGINISVPCPVNFNINNKNELKNEIEKNKDEILQIANNTICENDKKYTSSIKIGKISYDKKDNMQTQMYSGTYDSASVILGSGNGKNMWSIIFPNDSTIEKIKELDTIIPGISNIYNHDEEIETDDKQINSLILDFLKKK